MGVSASDNNTSVETTETQAVVFGLLRSMPLHESIGVVFSWLLHCYYSKPASKLMLRRCLSERVMREGFSGESMISLLNRLAR